MKGNFQLIFIAVFIGLAILGLFVFSGAIPIGTSNGPGSLGTVYIWGTIRNEVMSPLLQDLNNANQSITIKYVQKSASTFDQDLLEALADGAGPDMVFLPDNLVFRYANKILTIPYSSYSLASFNNSFAGAGGVFLTSKGILAFPMTVDPMVMYYNRSMLDSSGVVSPPATWDDLAVEVPILTKRDEANKIIKSGVAMGHFSNVTHAKDIISAMFMQVGNKIVGEKDGAFKSDLSFNQNLSSMLTFYISFADPNGPLYSWNKSFPNSINAFSREDLAFYFGYASELSALVNANPNQDFLAATFPQLKNSNLKSTNARVIGLALLSSSKNFDGALAAVNLLTTGDFASKFSVATGVPPARRDLLKAKPDDPFSATFFNSALFAKSWLDPEPKNTDDIFRSMIDQVLSNALSVNEALSSASNRINILLQR